jgi:hypothetical protein
MAAPDSGFHKVVELRQAPAPGMTVRRETEYNRISRTRIQPTLCGIMASEILVLFFKVSI